MNVQLRSAQVLPLYPVGALLTIDAEAKATESKTFNAAFMARLRALNEMARWLRTNGHPPMTMHLQGRLPAVHVDGAAAQLLIREAGGFNGRRINETHRHCSVELRGCLVTWFEQIHP